MNQRMEDRQRKNNSGEKFSFPDMSESEFEFGSVTPGSPRSPADHLFSNGKLLPHSFPIQPRNSTSFSRSMSRTSSIGSKDSSFLSSRSNSTNSSSSCSSARTSISTETCSSDQKKTSSQGKVAGKIQITRERKKKGEIKPVLTSQPYGSSQRWLFISPMPALNHQTSRRKRSSETTVQERGKRKNVVEGKKSKKNKGYLRRFLMYFVLTCGACHAMNPSRESVLKENF